MADTISWVATVSTIAAASLTAANLGSKITGYGFVVFTLGALCWIAVGVTSHQPALLWTNVVLTVLDVFGIWRWLGRQAKVEEGARTATEKSELSRGEALFRVSILSSAPVQSGTAALGRCIDAMAGSTSGRISYIVVSQGGVAGVGETLRRVPWSEAKVDAETVLVAMNRSEFERLEIVQRDQWPGR